MSVTKAWCRFKLERWQAGLAVLVVSSIVCPISRAADKVVIAENNISHPMDCGGNALILSGSSNHLQLTNCPDVSVSGSHNTLAITFRTQGHVTVTGDANQVTWRNRPGIPTAISDKGKGNRIERVAYE
jgi:hypothetical protein